ncbi:MAG: 30S ribosomal protein S21 [Candidatus Sungbacteria bacterium]|nr:30S ribosomal protein S21 [Candidatus Sungbacteria bacterium]
MVEVRRKENETTGAMLRRFTRRMQLSGVLIRARRTRFYQSKLTKRAVRERAMMRIKKAKERAHLEKLGKLTKEDKR